MIQRIQTLYLVIVVILMASLFFMPFSYGVDSVGDGSPVIANILYMNILLSAIIIPFAAIFFYKKRRIQIILCIVEIVLLFGIQFYWGLCLYRIYKVAGSAPVVFWVAGIFPLVSIIFVCLALRGIRKDEALIKSLDRIR